MLGFVCYISFDMAAHSAGNGAYSKAGEFRAVDLSRSRLGRRVEAELRRFVREDMSIGGSMVLINPVWA